MHYTYVQGLLCKPLCFIFIPTNTGVLDRLETTVKDRRETQSPVHNTTPKDVGDRPLLWSRQWSVEVREG